MACRLIHDDPCPQCDHRTGIHQAYADVALLHRERRCTVFGCDCNVTLTELGCDCPPGEPA